MVSRDIYTAFKKVNYHFWLHSNYGGKIAFTADAALGTKVYWTGVTKSGCGGQYTDCFLEAGARNIGYKKNILPSDGGGSCVGVTNYGKSIIAKTVPCETTLYLACYGMNFRTSNSIQIIYVKIIQSFESFQANLYFSKKYKINAKCFLN
jgi:hypothetical protein